MGKSRRSRNRPHRSDPIAKPVKPLTDPELVALRESRILPVIKDLQSPEPKSRTAAAGAIANIIQDAKCRKLLLREQVVHIVLTQTLTDNSIESRAAGWDILKVLAHEEDSDFCVHLYRLDILTAIEHAAKAVVDALVALETPFSKTPKAQQRVVWDIATALVSLLGAVAVARDEALEAIVANRSILRFLFVLAANEATPPDLLDEVLSCLITLSEENLDFGQVAIDDQETRFYDLLLKFKEGSGSRAVSACGILHNIFGSLEWRDRSRGQDGACDAILIPSLTRVLGQTSLSHHPANGNHGSSPSEVLQLALEILASMGTDLQTAIEQAAHPKDSGRAEGEEWGGFDDADADAMEEDEGADEMEDGESADGDDDEEMDQDEMEADMEMVTGADHVDSEGSDLDDLPTLRELIQKAVPQAIKWSQIPLDSDEAIAVQGHALSTLNNIAWTMSSFEFADGKNAGIYRLWAPAAKKVWTNTVAPILASDTADVSLATQVTSLAWAIARSLAGNTPLTGDEHRKFITLYQASKNLDRGNASGAGESSEAAEDPFQGLGVKCIGVLGQLARDPAPIDLNREIGVFLITVLTGLPETPGADVVEALDRLIDTYADENFPCDKEVFWKDNFIKHLEEILPKVKVMTKAIDKRRFGELRARADDAVLNLGGFITYKRKHAP